MEKIPINRSVFTLIMGILFWFSCGKKDEIKITTDPSAELISPDEVLISWETNIPGDSRVDYGLTSDFGSTEVDKEERELHSITIANLDAKTTYYYKVQSQSSQTDTKTKSGLLDFTTGENEESIARTGWEFFAQDQLDSAISYFEQALFINLEYGWPLVGLGWVNLRRNDISEALNKFEEGLSFNNSILEGHVGRAAVNLTFAEYDSVISDGIYVMEADSNYIFQYDESIDFRDVRIMLAQAYYATGKLESAQIECDILFSGNELDPAQPSTWIVNDVLYDTYPLALLNLINYLDTLY